MSSTNRDAGNTGARGERRPAWYHFPRAGRLPAAIWLAVFGGLHLLEEAADRAGHDLLAAFLLIGAMWTLPIFLRWLMARVHGGLAHAPRSHRLVIRLFDVVAIWFVGFMMGMYAVSRALVLAW